MLAPLYPPRPGANARTRLRSAPLWVLRVLSILVTAIVLGVTLVAALTWTLAQLLA